jgi:hypothetical protein
MLTTLKPTASTHHRLAIAATFGVDAPTGALTGLQLLAANREALGHGFWIDQKTLDTALAVITEDGGLLKGYVTHNHAGPCRPWESPDADEASSELNVAGWFSGIAIVKEQLVADRFDFFDAFKKNFAPQFEQISEMAAKTPSLLGLSIEPWGYLVYVDTAGNEYGAAPENTELLYNGMPALRVTDLWAAAFVSDGAATDGLFAKLSRKLKTILGGSAERSPANNKGDSPATTEPKQLTTSPTMKLITDLKAKLGTNAARLAAAMAVVGESATPETLTVELVEAQLGVKDLADVRTQLGAVTTERDTLKTQLGVKDTEIADLKRQVTALQTSGHVGGVNLGVGGGQPVGDTENPWITGNLTQQALMTKNDPVKAASLELAAKNAPKK